MEFKVALATVCKNRTGDAEITDPFLLYSRLSDLCSASYGAKERLLLFYQIDSRLHVIEGLLSGKRDLYSRHEEVSDLVGVVKFRTLLDTVKAVLDNPAKALSSAKVTATPAVAKVNQAPAKAKRTPNAPRSVGFNPAKVRHAPQSQSAKSTATRFTTINPAGSSDVLYLVLGAAALTVVALFIAALIFGWSWTFWQWYIGLVVCTVACVFITCFPLLASAADELFSYTASLIATGSISITSFILRAIFGAEYKIIFGCLSALLIATGCIIGLCAFGSSLKAVVRLAPFFALCGFVTLTFTVIAVTWF